MILNPPYLVTLYFQNNTEQVILNSEKELEFFRKKLDGDQLTYTISSTNHENQESNASTGTGS
jgi:hypothetical protein